MVRKVINGNMATAQGSRVCEVEVISAYPITPQTLIVEYIADFVANGEMPKTQYIKVESEHSVMACCIGAANTGARTFTATSSHGLLLMHEMLAWASGARLPVVLVNVNRANGPPWSVWADHTDTIMQRDTGWMSMFCENNQEILDNTIQAFKVSEDPEIKLPTMLSEDAFILSHTYEPVDIPEIELVREYLPPYKANPEEILDVDNPKGFGSLVMPPNYMEFKYNLAKAMDDAREKIRQADKDFERIFGRSHGGMMDFYRCDDADYVLIGAGTTASTVREVVDELREEGKKVGLARMRVFRPFPFEEVREIASKVKAIGVFERGYGYGWGGPFWNEVMASLYNTDIRIPVKDYFLGLGGRDVRPKHIRAIYNNLEMVARDGIDEEIKWWGLLDGNTPEEEL
jgi:2-oxoisovalerate ferredoxin oxidoreductase alpha subunit